MAVRIMAIINTSPDSFSGDGLHATDKEAVRRKLTEALAAGADILDIGGQSTRPGAEIITETEEIARVVPVITIARQLAADIPISIDTFKPGVAEAALKAGATMVNDVTGLSDTAMIHLAAAAGCDIVVMHMRGTPQTMSGLTSYPAGVVSELIDFFRQKTASLIEAGIAKERIIIDPGIGFAKTAAQSFELTRRLPELAALGFPILYGASNKSFIGKALAKNGIVAPVEHRVEGTVALQAWAMAHGAAVIRAHDVRAAVRTRTIIEALLGEREVMP